MARELALDLGDASFAPDVLEQIPGVAHTMADTLSRRFQPGVNFALPVALASVEEAHPQAREGAYSRTLGHFAVT